MDNINQIIVSLGLCAGLMGMLLMMFANKPTKSYWIAVILIVLGLGVVKFVTLMDNPFAEVHLPPTESIK